MARSAWTTVAVTAAVLALTGLATAGAAELITSNDIRNFSIQAKDISSKAKKQLRGNRGPRGRRGKRGKQGKAGAAGAQGSEGIQGPKGDTGANGTNGADGAAGAAGAAMVLGAVTPPLNPNGDVFAYPSGAGTASPTVAGAQMPTPVGAATTVKDLSVLLSTPAGAGRSYAIAINVDGTDTAVKCTAADPAVTCNSAALSAPVAAGGKLSIKVTGTGGATPATISWGFRMGA